MRNFIAFIRGYWSEMTGKSNIDNPYPVGTSMYDYWNEGFFKSHIERI